MTRPSTKFENVCRVVGAGFVMDFLLSLNMKPSALTHQHGGFCSSIGRLIRMCAVASH